MYWVFYILYGTKILFKSNNFGNGLQRTLSWSIWLDGYFALYKVRFKKKTTDYFLKFLFFIWKYNLSG